MLHSTSASMKGVPIYRKWKMLALIGGKGCAIWEPSSSTSQNDLELGKIFKDHLVQSPCNDQGHFQRGWVAHSLVQPDFDCLQEWGIHSLSGQHAPAFHHSHCYSLSSSGCAENND